MVEILSDFAHKIVNWFVRTTREKKQLNLETHGKQKQ